MEEAAQTAKYPRRILIVVIGLIGDILQGGLIFGWPSLSLILEELGTYSQGCPSNSSSDCTSRAKSFSLDWTMGAFAVNFGPVLIGPALDYFGPRFVAIFASSLNAACLILLARSNSLYFNAYPAATFGMGFGGMAFHLAQFNKQEAFPNMKGTISSCFNGGFCISSSVMLFVYVIWSSLGRSQAAFSLILYVYAGIVVGFIPLLLLFEPREAVNIYLKKKQIEMDAKKQSQEEDEDVTQPLLASSMDMSIERICNTNNSLATQGLLGTLQKCSPDEAPCQPARQSNSLKEDKENKRYNLNGISDSNIEKSIDTPSTSIIDIGTDESSSVQLYKKSPRWEWLGDQKFTTQLFSPEAIGLCFYFSISVLMLQFYLGTARLQLESKGDVNHVYTDLTGPIVALGFLTVPLVAWLLDSVGFGTTLLVILCGGVLDSLLQAVPNLQIQIATLVVWSADGFCLYAAFYSIVGSIFSFTNFGKIVAVISVINGFMGFLQYPLLQLVLGPLNGQFIYVNLAQAIILSALFPFCIKLMMWAKPNAQPAKQVSSQIV